MFILNGKLPWWLQLFAFGFGAMLFGLSVSKVIVSISQFIMAFAWINSGNLKQRVIDGFNSKLTVSLTIVFIVHLIGLLYTSNYTYAINDIKIKLPLLVLPFLISGMPPLTEQWKKIILIFFWLGLTVSSFATLYLYLGFGNKTITDSRYLSPFVSHIRFSIMLVFGILSTAYLFYKERKLYYLFFLLLFAVALFLIKSGTGWALLLFSIVLISIVIKFKYRLAVIGALILVVFSSVYWVYGFYINHFKVSKDFKLFNINANARLYEHYPSNEIENGFYVWKNISEEELSKAWDKVSDISITQNDLNNQPLKNTLVRYLTSKHLTKDSAGVAQLKSNDIYNIRNGFTNYKFTDQKSLSYKIYQTLYEIHMFYTMEYANNHSLTMRLLFAQTGLNIWANNFWLGVGTGDVQEAFNWQYEYNQVRLDPENRLRAHNQFITFGLSFGFIGFLIIIIAFGYLFIRANKIETITLLILFASFLNEDTLETQIGVSMFCAILSYVFIIFSKKSES